MNRNSRVSAAAAFGFLLLAWPGISSSQAPDDAWKAYLVDKDGKEEPFPANAAGLKDKEWLNVRYTEHAGFKPRLGVVLSEEKTGIAGAESDWARVLIDVFGQSGAGQPTNPFNHIEDLVRQALGATNRFVMLERTTAKDDVLEEQDFGAGGRVDKKTAAEIGKIKGADYIVKATVIELNPEKDSKDIGVAAGALGGSALGIGSVGVSGKVAFCRLNVRIINSETSEIVSDLTVDGTARSSGLSVGGLVGGASSKVLGGVAGGSSNKKGVVLSDAMQACANKIAYNVARKLEDAPWQGSVASVNGPRVTINAGSNVGLKAGLTLKLLSKGEEITDPDTGESLGFETTEIGVLRIVSVQEKFSTCEIVSGAEGVKKGDTVRLEKTGE